MHMFIDSLTYSFSRRATLLHVMCDKTKNRIYSWADHLKVQHYIRIFESTVLHNHIVAYIFHHSYPQ